MDVMIIGAGIGGLSLALSLLEKGINPTIYESVREIKPLGVGINVLPHATAILTDLGLQDRLRETGIETKELCYFNKFGQEIWREPRGIAAGYPVPQFSIHRGYFQKILLEAAQQRLAKGRIKFGLSYKRHTITTSGKVAVWLEDRSTHELTGPLMTDVLVAADGIHSAVRAGFYPDEGPPRWSGAVLWRAAVESAPFLSGRSMIMAGHADQKIVIYPISRNAFERGQSYTNWIAELTLGQPGDPAPTKESWNKAGRKEDFLPEFKEWVYDWLDYPKLAESTNEIFEFPMVDRDPVEAWSFGPVTLLGDAAHPMYPIGSNGASQAIIDARTLANFIAENKFDIPGALKKYEAERLPATAAIVAANRRQGPDEIMQIVHERAPDGFKNIDDVISKEEREQIAAKYKQLAGFDQATVSKVAQSSK
jgi:2-polyprenyl-6-methoxyphenol hydroxylase-like FAD-dependent oxidoreductase